MAKAARSGSKKKVRYAVVGLGFISQIAMLPAFAHARENSEPVSYTHLDVYKRQVAYRALQA